MTDIQLSICIATFNRSSFIGDTLNSILSQVTDDVELVIVDGASTDNTENVVTKFQQRFPGLRYYRQAENMGVDRDFNRAVEFARGNYCWLMSDDDLLKPSAIATILNHTRHKYDLMIVNAEVRNADLSEILDTSRLETSADRIYRPRDAEALFTDLAFYLTFIGCVVIKRELWLQRDRQRYFGTVFVHVGVIFQRRLEHDTLVVAQPLIMIRYGNALWTAKAFDIWMFKWPDLIWSFNDYSPAAKARVVAREPWRRPATLLIYRAKGAYSLAEYRRHLRPRLRSMKERLYAKVIAALPGVPIHILATIYISRFYRRSRMPMLDLRNSRFHYCNMFSRSKQTPQPLLTV